MTKVKTDKVALIKEWEASGLTKSTFCKEKKIPLSSFYSWFKKSPSIAESSSPLVKVATSRSQKVLKDLILEFPRGEKLHIPSNNENPNLIAVISALKEVL